MDLKARADLVRSIRCEIKQRRSATQPRLTSDEQRDRNATRWLRSADRRRPRLARDAGPEALGPHRRAVRAYESDIGRHGGFAVGERLRELHESGTMPSQGSETRANFTRRMNVRFQSRTSFSGPDGVMTSLTPSQRVNRVGVASRRRRVSRGLVPGG